MDAQEVQIDSVKTLNTKGGGIGVLVTFPLTERNGNLVLMLMRARGLSMRLTFEVMQPDLEPVKRGDENAGVTIPDGAVQVFETPEGDVTQAHAFVPSAENDRWCDLCKNGETHPVHSAAAIARLAEQQKLTDRLLNERDEITDPEEAMEEALARALARASAADKEAPVDLAGRRRPGRPRGAD